MSSPACRYSPSTSAALPTPCFPSIAIVRTLCVATVISLFRARSRSRSRSDIALRPAALRAGLSLRRFFLAFSFLRLVIFFRTKIGRVPFPLGLSPFAPDELFSRGGFGIPLLPRRPIRLPFPGRIWCLLAGASLSLRFPRRCCLLAMAVGTDGSGRRLNKVCIVNTIGVLLLTCLLYTSPSPRDS